MDNQTIRDKAIYIRQVLRKFGAENSTYIILAAKAAVMTAVLLTVSRYFDGVHFLSRTIVAVAIALIASVLPWDYSTFLAAVFLLGQLSALTVEGTLSVLAVLMGLALIRYLTLPKGSVVMAILPVLCLWKIPYAVPIIVGLAGGFSGFVSVGGGLLIWYLLQFISRNMAYLQDEGVTLVQKLLFLVKGMMAHEEMLFVIISFCLTALLVYLVSHLEINYSHVIAILLGAVFCPVLMSCCFRFAGVEGEMGGRIWGSLLAAAAALLYDFYTRALNYAKTERVRFEDDDYYYYVKAVPKINVPVLRRQDKAAEDFDKAETNAFRDAMTQIISLHGESEDEEKR